MVGDVLETERPKMGRPQAAVTDMVRIRRATLEELMQAASLVIILKTHTHTHSLYIIVLLQEATGKIRSGSL